MTQTDNSAIVATPLNGHIGAEISNIDLGRPLAQADFDGLQAALARYEVLVFRDQDISLEAQIAFAKRFGNLSTHPFATNLPDVPEVIEFDNSGRNHAGPTDSWHSDETFRARPPMATILRAKVVPPYGGETVFASMTAAYDGLSEPMKVYVHRLRARHDFKPWRHMFADSKAARMKLIELEDEFPNPMHPIVRIHPVTGRRVLFVNPQFTVGIEGLKEDEGQTILNFLYRQAMVPDYQLRLKWRPHTIVMWDNRSTQHYAPHDYYPHRRNMARLTVEAGPSVVMSLSDDITGIQGTVTTTAVFPNGTTYFGGASLVSGTANNGVWSVSIPVSLGMPVGFANINVGIVDAAGNRRNYNFNDLRQLGLDYHFEIVNSIFRVKGVSIFDQNFDGCDSIDFRSTYIKFRITTGNYINSYISKSNGTYLIPNHDGKNLINPIIENAEFF